MAIDDENLDRVGEEDVVLDMDGYDEDGDAGEGEDWEDVQQDD